MIRERFQQLLGLLARWDRRLRLQQSVLWLPRSLIISLALGVALAAAARLRPVLMRDQVLLISGGAILAGLAIMLAVIWLRQPDALRVARRFDDLFDLKERVSTALELASGGIRSPNEEITTRLVDDTLTRAAGVNAAAYLPLRVRGREVLIALGLALALGLLVFLPNPQHSALAEQQAFETALQQQIEGLQNLREQIAAEEGLDAALRREMLEALDETVEQLTREQMSQEEAFATLSDLAEEMRQIASGEGPATESPQQREMQEALEQAMQEMARNMQSGSAAQNDAPPPPGMLSAQEALQGLSDAVGEMSAAEQQAMAEALQTAADQLAEAAPALSEAFQQAAEALEQGDTAAAQDALEEASQEAGELARQAGEMQQPATVETRTRQMASQAAQQAQQSAQEMAQAGEQQGEGGQQSGDQPGQQGGDQSGEGNTATRIEQAPPGQEGQAAQVSGADQGQPGEQAQPSGQQSAGQSAGQSGGGAGDDAGAQQEGGFAASGEQISQENSPTGDGLTEYDPVFAPQRIGPGEGPQMPVSGSGEPGDVVTQEGEFMENPEGEAIVGYDEVFSDYANAANQAMERDYIPLTLRDVIHDYFAALAP